MSEQEGEEKTFEAMFINEQLTQGTIEEKLAEFGLNMEDAALMREFQDTRNWRFFLSYLRFRGKAKRYFKKYGDYFAF